MYFWYKINIVILPKSLGDGMALKQERLREFFCTREPRGNTDAVSNVEETGMRGKTGEIGKLFMVVLCVVALFGCAPRQEAEKSAREQETAQRVLMKKEQAETALEGLSQESEVEAFGEVEYSPEEQLRKNEEKLYEEAGYQGVSRREADTYLQILMDDNIFQNGAMELTGIRIADMDGNGQTDMLVVVQNVQEKYLYGTGGLWFYMNEDEPYCFWRKSVPILGGIAHSGQISMMMAM